MSPYLFPRPSDVDEMNNWASLGVHFQPAIPQSATKFAPAPILLPATFPPNVSASYTAIMTYRPGLRLMRIQPSLLPAGGLPSLSSVTSRRVATSQWAARRAASSSSPAAAARESPKPAPQAVITPLNARTPTPEPVDPDVPLSATLNPPASTRPPPLHVPERDPQSSLFSYLFSLGKAYTTFYKNGLKAILTNRRLLAEVDNTSAPPPALRGHATSVTQPTRAAALLRERTRHDLARLPAFGLLVLICGEFTPLVVLAFPKLTPLTCRIPKQIAKLRETARRRREASLRKLQYTDPKAWDKMAPGHVLRSLGLGLGVWDRVGVDPPFAKSRAERALRRVVEDDFRIRQGGGVKYLEDDEVVIACEDRAIHTSITPVADLRKQLHQWVAETTKKDQKGGEDIATRLLLSPKSEQ